MVVKKTPPKEPPRKVGRPTAYRPEMCDRVIELGKLGKSKAQMAADFGISREYLDDWAKRFPEFGDAFARARVHAQAWWENEGERGMWQEGEGAKLNYQLWARSIAARFPDDYSERTKLEHSGNIGLHELVVSSLAKPDVERSG